MKKRKLGNSGIEVAAFFRESINGRWRISLRSKGSVDVAAIAAPFGGGGHTCAAGFSVAGTLSEVRDLVLGQLRTALARSAIQ